MLVGFIHPPVRMLQLERFVNKKNEQCGNHVAHFFKVGNGIASRLVSKISTSGYLLAISA